MFFFIFIGVWPTLLITLNLPYTIEICIYYLSKWPPGQIRAKHDKMGKFRIKWNQTGLARKIRHDLGQFRPIQNNKGQPGPNIEANCRPSLFHVNLLCSISIQMKFLKDLTSGCWYISLLTFWVKLLIWYFKLVYLRYWGCLGFRYTLAWSPKLSL